MHKLKEIRARMDEAEFIETYLQKRNNFYVDIGASTGGNHAYGSSTTTPLHNKGWSGVSFEPDLSKFERLLKNQKDNIIKINSFVKPHNVIAQLKGANVPRVFDFLSIDIDGYDFFVLDSLLKKFRPSLICCEINEKVPPPIKFSVLFHKDYAWDAGDFYGFSISMLEDLCKTHDYDVVDLCYNNAFLVPSELNAFDKRSIEDIYKEGYVNAFNRHAAFSYNDKLDYWLDLSPKEALNEMDNHFSKASEYLKYKDKFVLTL